MERSVSKIPLPLVGRAIAYNWNDADDPLPLEGRDRGWGYEDSFLIRFAAKRGWFEAIGVVSTPTLYPSPQAGGAASAVLHPYAIALPLSGGVRGGGKPVD
jgi:hypothetical protein